MGAARFYERIALHVSSECREASALEDFVSASRRIYMPH